MKMLLDAGADVNARDTHNRTALHHSAYWGSSLMMKLLLDAGAEVNARDPSYDSGTPLHLVLGREYQSCNRRTDQDRDREAISLLVGKGAEIEAKNAYGETPLRLAIVRNRLILADELVRLGASVEKAKESHREGKLRRLEDIRFKVQMMDFQEPTEFPRAHGVFKGRRDFQNKALHTAYTARRPKIGIITLRGNNGTDGATCEKNHGK